MTTASDIFSAAVAVTASATPAVVSAAVTISSAGVLTCDLHVTNVYSTLREKN